MRTLSMLLIAAGVAWGQGVKLPGELQPWLKVALTARVTGIVERVNVDRGSVVKPGDLLVELSAPEMQAQVAEVEARALAVEAQRIEAEARVTAAESTLEKLKAASETRGAVAANDLVQAQKQVEALRALSAALGKSAAAVRSQIAVLRELQEYLQVKAPFAGVVVERLVHPGALASSSSGPLLVVEQVSRLRLVVALPESEWRSLPAGARAVFTVPAWPGKNFDGVVARAAHSLDPKTRTMAVELDVANPSGALAPGMYAEVTLPARSK